MIGFEIHTYKDGRWLIDALFDDRDLAVLEAKRIDQSKRYAGVLVIEETYDEATNNATWRTIFRGGRFANRFWGDLYAMRRKSQRAETKARQRRDRLPTAGEKPRAKSTGFLRPIMTLLVLAACCLTAMYTLHQIFLRL